MNGPSASLLSLPSPGAPASRPSSSLLASPTSRPQPASSAIRLARASLVSLVFGALAALAALLSACGDEVAEPYQLGHPRLLAIRTEPAVLPPGSEARLDALFTDGSAPPRLATARIRSSSPATPTVPGCLNLR